MYVYESATKTSQYCYCCGGIVNEGTTLAVGCEFAADDALVGVKIKIFFVEELFKTKSFRAERCFKHTALLAVLYGRSVSTFSSEQTNGSKQYTLACTRLAGNDRKTLIKVYVKTLDECVVLYM